MRWYERILLFVALTVMLLCSGYFLIRWLPELWYGLTLYRDLLYWALLAAAGIVAFASWKDD